MLAFIGIYYLATQEAKADHKFTLVRPCLEIKGERRIWDLSQWQSACLV